MHEGLTVTVDRRKLIEMLRKNSAQHVTDYQEAIQGFKKSYEDYVQGMLDDVQGKEGFVEHDQLDMRVDLPVPRCYTKQYDDAIELLEMGTAETVELSMDDFKRLVKDEWMWKRDFVAVSERYKG